MRVVIDTNVLASALIRCQGVSGEVLRALRAGQITIIYSTTLMLELVDVLSRPHVQRKYGVESTDISALLHLIRLRGELVKPSRRVAICRDPRDNWVLETALEGQAQLIVSRDADLLDLGNIEDIPILSVAAFLAGLGT